MKILTTKYILLEHQIMGIFTDPEEYLLNNPEDECIDLKTKLGMFLSNPDIKFFGIYFVLDLEGYNRKNEWFSCTEEELEEIMADICESEILDLRSKI